MKSLFGSFRIASITFLFLSLPILALRHPSRMSQKTLQATAEMHQVWQINLSQDWDVLGPFPIHAREQHFISPGFPLKLSSPYRHEGSRSWPSSLSETAEVTWRKAQSDLDGNLAIEFDEVRWSKFRATEGWAGLQHHSVLHTTLTVQPPRSKRADEQLPRIRVQLNQGSFFAILPREPAGLHPEWHVGNIYAVQRAPANSIELPETVQTDNYTTFDFFISGDYEIRLFGDPRDNVQETPTLKLNIDVYAEEKRRTIAREESHDVICDFVDGLAFGNALGVGLRSVDGWWIVKGIQLPIDFPQSIVLSVLNKQQIAPSQTRIVPISIEQFGKYDGNALSFEIILTEKRESVINSGPMNVTVPVTLPLRQLPVWNSSNWDPIRATFFFASSHPTYFITKPPIASSSDKRAIPILALHGAGVDIISQPFWADAVPRQKHSWIVIPVGRTEWGLDWHGPSASEAWATLSALSSILRLNENWKSWSFPADSRAVILGHSNGGQGTWYLASRFPDRTHAVVAAAGFLNAAAYVPLTLSHGARFVDPALCSVLESSYVPDDNALFLGNLADSIPVLAIHGGDDTNVPTWHSREYVSIIKTWGKGLNVSLHIDEGQPHWYPGVFESDPVRVFLEEALTPEVERRDPTSGALEFILTVADPIRSGSKNGWKIEQLLIPGRLARLHIRMIDGIIIVKTVNVRRFRIVSGSTWFREIIKVDQTILSELSEAECNHEWIFMLEASGIWLHETTASSALSLPPGRVQNVFDTPAPLAIVISSDPTVYQKSLSAALRIAHSLNVYLKLDSEILLDTDAIRILEAIENEKGSEEQEQLQGNLVILGGKDNALSRRLLMPSESKSEPQTEFSLSEGGLWLFRGQTLNKGDDNELGIIFTHPHPTNPSGISVFLSSTSTSTSSSSNTHLEDSDSEDSEGLERVLRLFIPRTGIAIPDWIVVSKEIDEVGAGGVIGAGVWDSSWKWNEAMSYLF